MQWALYLQTLYLKCDNHLLNYSFFGCPVHLLSLSFAPKHEKLTQNHFCFLKTDIPEVLLTYSNTVMMKCSLDFS